MADNKFRLAAALVAATLCLTACSASDDGTASRMTKTIGEAEAAPSLDARLQRMVDNMTPQQKAAQLVIVGLMSSGPPGGIDLMVSEYGIGGILLLDSWQSAEAVQQVVTHLNALVPAGGPGLYISADQEGGQIQRVSGPGFDKIPPATDQGTMPVDQLTKAAATWGAQLKAAGVNLNLAPVADTVPAGFEKKNGPIGKLHREFGTSPDVTGPHAAAFVAGMNSAGEQACVKHFPGLGRIVGNTDLTAKDVVDATTTATDPFIGAFRDAIAAGPAMVMVSLATYTQIDADNPAVFSQAIITDLLRGKLGWTGVVIADALDSAAVRDVPVEQRVIRFVQAGGDIVVFTTTGDAITAIDGLTAQMGQSPDFQRQVDTSLLRVLRAKYAAGLVKV